MENFAEYLSSLPQTTLTEAVVSLYESVHTSRAKKVNEYTKKLLQLVWRYFDEPKDTEIDSRLCFYPFDLPVTAVLDFRKPQNPPAEYILGKNEVTFSVGGFLLAASYYEANSMKQSQLDAMEALANEKLANNTSETIKLSANEVDLIRRILHTDIFMQYVRHELTHMVQDFDTGYDAKQFDHEKQLTKLGLSSENPMKYHDVYPWEIDAGVHQRVVEIINHIANYEHPMKMARIVYNHMMEECKDLGINDADLKKQCWETAASLTRAVAMAKKEGKHVDAEAILDHIDDYAV